VVNFTHPTHFNPKETDYSTHYTGGYVGLTAGLDTVARRKIPSLPLLGNELRSFSL